MAFTGDYRHIFMQVVEEMLGAFDEERTIAMD